jgi:putative addiction module component (TIGR02574 family)
MTQEQIRQLSLKEKLALFESLWAEISADANQVEVPKWHKDLLDSREEALKRGDAKVLEWEEAKRQIDQKIR